MDCFLYDRDVRRERVKPLPNSEVHPGTPRTSKMESFETTVNSKKSLTVVAKLFILNFKLFVCGDPC